MSGPSRHQAGATVAGEKTGGQFRARPKTGAVVTAFEGAAGVITGDFEAGERTFLDDRRRRGGHVSAEVWVDERLGRYGNLTADEWRFAMHRTWQQAARDRSMPQVSGAYPALAAFLEDGMTDRGELRSDLTRLVADRADNPIHRPLVQIAERYLEFGEHA